jgi:hypothetical protein
LPGFDEQSSGFGERDETDSEMLQFLQCGQQVCHRAAPAIQPPHQHDIDFAAARRFHQLLASLSLDSSGTDFAHL